MTKKHADRMKTGRLESRPSDYGVDPEAAEARRRRRELEDRREERMLNKLFEL